MLSRSWNREYDPSDAPILDRIQWASQRFECEVELRGIATLNTKDGTHEWAYVRAVVGPKTPGSVVRQPLEYPEVRFEHEFVSVASFLERFADVRATNETKDRYVGKFKIGGLTANLFTSNVGWDTASCTSGDHMCQFPYWTARFPLQSQSPRSDVLISSKTDHPLYEGLGKLRADVGGFAVHRGDDMRAKSFGVFVVDQRSWLRGLRAGDDGLEITTRQHSSGSRAG